MTVAKFLAQTLRAHGRGRPGLAKELIAEGVRSGKFKRNQINLLDLAQQTFGASYGLGLERFARTRSQVVESLTAEAFDPAVDSTAFAAVTSAMFESEIEDAYNYATSMVESITGEYPTPDKIGEIEILDHATGVEEARTVGEAEPYPQMGVSGVKITVPKPEKIGLSTTVTLEALTDGRTADRLDAAAEVGRKVGREWSSRILKLMFGITNSFKRNGTSYNTYLTSGAWTNHLEDFNQANGPDEFDRFEQLFDNMTNPISGEQIDVGSVRQIVVPRSNLYRTRKNLNAQELRFPGSGAVPELVTTNPLAGLPEPIGDPLVRKLLTDSGIGTTVADSYVVYGDTSRAFYRRIVRPFEVLERDGDLASEIGFRQDIVYACKARIWGVPFVRRPQLVCLGRKTS